MNPEADLGGSVVVLEPDPVARAFAMHAPELRRYAAARLRDTVAAEDVVQESFLRLAVEAGAGRFPRQPRAWLYRVAINLIISGARRARTSAAAGAAATLDGSEPADVETPESRCLTLERHHVVRTAMASVDPHARTGLLMAAEGYSGREIALAIGRSELATRALLCRARVRVRQTLLLAEAG